MLLSNQNCQFPQYVATIIATLSAFSVGQCLSWSSSAIPLLLARIEDGKLKVSRAECSWIVSLIALGALIGSIPTGLLSNRYGPKRLLVSLSILVIVGWNFIAFGSNVWWLYVGRLLLGIAAGGICVTTPILIKDVAEEAISSKLNGLYQIQFTLGILFQYVLGKSIEDFKSLALTSTCVTIIFLITFAFVVPESPIYLIRRRNYRLAETNLQLLRWNYDVSEEFETMRDRVEVDDYEDGGSQKKVSTLIRSKATAKAILVSLGLMALQQLSGANVILFYAAQIFNESTTTTLITGNSCAIFIGILQVLGATLSVTLIDCCGRRTLLISSVSVMWISMSVLTGYLCLSDRSSIWIPLITINASLFLFSIGLGPVPWIMMSELFLDEIRTLAISVAVATNWLLAFVVLKTFDDVLEQFGATLTFAFYSSMCFLTLLFVIGLVPETMGRSIGDVIRLLSDGCDESDEKKRYLFIERMEK